MDYSECPEFQALKTPVRAARDAGHTEEQVRGYVLDRSLRTFVGVHDRAYHDAIDAEFQIIREVFREPPPGQDAPVSDPEPPAPTPRYSARISYQLGWTVTSLERNP